MTLQEIFDSVVLHFVKQGRPAMHNGTYTDRNHKREMSAIGFFKYKYNMSRIVEDLLSPQGEDLLYSLEALHDNKLLWKSPHNFKFMLMSVANNYDLSSAVLYENALPDKEPIFIDHLLIVIALGCLAAACLSCS